MLTATACAGFIMGNLEAKDFMMLTVSAFSFYFGYKPTDSNNTILK